MRRIILIVVVVAFLVGFVPFASAQVLVTTFPGTPSMPGLSAPVAFPGSADPGRPASYPIRPETGGPPAPSNPPVPGGLSYASFLCTPLGPVGNDSMIGSYVGMSRTDWSWRHLSRDAHELGRAKTWHSLFMAAGSLAPMSQSLSWFNADPSTLCRPN